MKTIGFLIFSVRIERNQWHEMNWFVFEHITPKIYLTKNDLAIK